MDDYGFMSVNWVPLKIHCFTVTGFVKCLIWMGGRYFPIFTRKIMNENDDREIQNPPWYSIIECECKKTIPSSIIQYHPQSTSVMMSSFNHHVLHIPGPWRKATWRTPPRAAWLPGPMKNSAEFTGFHHEKWWRLIGYHVLSFFMDDNLEICWGLKWVH